jgi:hypothetical protein
MEVTDASVAARISTGDVSYFLHTNSKEESR